MDGIRGALLAAAYMGPGHYAAPERIDYLGRVIVPPIPPTIDRKRVDADRARRKATRAQKRHARKQGGR